MGPDQIKRELVAVSGYGLDTLEALSVMKGWLPE